MVCGRFQSIAKKIAQQLLLAVGAIALTGYAGIQFDVIQFSGDQPHLVDANEEKIGDLETQLRISKQERKRFEKTFLKDKKQLKNEMKKVKEKNQGLKTKVEKLTDSNRELRRSNDELNTELYWATDELPQKVLIYLKGKYIALQNARKGYLEDEFSHFKSFKDNSAFLAGQSAGGDEARILVDKSKANINQATNVDSSDRRSSSYKDSN